MLFAIINHQKAEAKPKTTATCPLCGHPVFSKCGEINVWHWAHKKINTCDDWYESETKWHKNWKLIFGKENCEVIISKDGIKHIADIWTKENVVVELQNSPIQKPIIYEREIFYGDRMIWIINGKHFKEKFDIRVDGLSLRLREEEENYRFNNPLSPEYGMAYKNTQKDKFSFVWSHPRRSWKDALRKVFIDFGDEDLFLVEEGIGTSNGKGIKVSKEKFIEEYGGNLELLATVIGT